MITFEEARQIVKDNRAHKYPPEAEFQVATWGWENEHWYQLKAGPYAMVYPPRGKADLAWLIPSDGPFITVNKETGEYVEHYGFPPYELEGSTDIGERRAQP